MAKKRDDKPAALDHALYEIEMLAYSLMTLRGRSMSNWRDGSGWLEVFAIHARNLNEFFAPSAEGGGYMKPNHFLQQWQYSYTSDLELVRRANSQISHLTYDREKPEEKTAWPFDQFFKPLRQQSLAFLRAVVLDDALMAYNHNRARAAALLDVLPKIRCQGDA